ncbi:MAG: hypothetical protein NVSMB60_08090 [Mycobacterium sp.]
MSTFAIGLSTVTFVADQPSFNERNDGGLRVWEFNAYLSLPADYTTLFSLRSWLVSKRAIPGGSALATVIDVGGGAGKGTLTLDFVLGSPFTAILTRITRPSSYPGGGRRAIVTFDESP